MAYLPGKNLRIQIEVEQPRVHDMRRMIVVAASCNGPPAPLYVTKQIPEVDSLNYFEEGSVAQAIDSAVRELLSQTDKAHQWSCECGRKYVNTKTGTQLAKTETPRAWKQK